MKARRLQKFILSFGIILSLVSSSLAACICSHHATAAKAENHAPSCHQTAPKKSHTETVENDSKNKFPIFEESCNCFVKISQPFIVGKSENIKAKKTPAILPVEIKTENYETISENASAEIHFEYHFYNSNYLKKLTPPRAPPVS